VTDKPLTGKTALVTGASRGIGRAIALRLAADGARIAAHGTKGAPETMTAIARVGGQAVSLAGDLATLAGVDQLAAGFRKEAGRPAPDILVNNAGIMAAPDDTLARQTEDRFDRLMAINVKAPFFLVQRFLADLPRDGRIVNISSRLSQIAFPDQIVYSATKTAINSLTKSLARELGPRGITVNAVGPGLIETDMAAARLAVPETRAYFTAMSPLKRIGQPDDVADVVAFLASPAGRWVTGAYIEASGGAGL